MAELHADTVWEMRTTGDNTNGGGFYDSNPGTSVDYSQQATAQLSLTDLAMVTGGTTLTSATGGFTAAMDGNLLHITSGTNFTAAWYQMTYVDSNTATLNKDATNGSDASAGVGKVGGCLGILTSAVLQEGTETYNTIYVKSGTFIATLDASGYYGATNLSIIGYETNRGDNPLGDARPVFIMGGYALSAGTPTLWKNIRVTSTANRGVDCSSGGYYYNVSVANTSGTSSRTGVGFNSYSYFFKSSISCTNGYCIFQRTSGTPDILYSFLHDCAEGFTVYDNIRCTNTIFSNCSAYGLRVKRGGLFQVTNGIFYNCGTGIYVENLDKKTQIVNTIINSCDTGINSIVDTDYKVLSYVNFYGNTTDRTNVTAGDSDTTHDPKFVDAGNGDFRLQSDSLCATAGVPITLGTGGNTVTTYQGAVPAVASAGGGSATRLVGGVLVG